MNRQPPFVPEAYNSSDALDDIPGLHWALHEFLHSRMIESEEYCHRVDPNKCVLTTVTDFQRPQCSQGEIVFRHWLWTHSVCEGSYVI